MLVVVIQTSTLLLQAQFETGHFDCHLSYVINDHCLQMKCFYKPIIIALKKNDSVYIAFILWLLALGWLFFRYGSKGEEENNFSFSNPISKV